MQAAGRSSEVDYHTWQIHFNKLRSLVRSYICGQGCFFKFGLNVQRFKEQRFTASLL